VKRFGFGLETKAGEKLLGTLILLTLEPLLECLAFGIAELLAPCGGQFQLGAVTGIPEQGVGLRILGGDIVGEQARGIGLVLTAFVAGEAEEAPAREVVAFLSTPEEAGEGVVRGMIEFAAGADQGESSPEEALAGVFSGAGEERPEGGGS